MFSCVPLYFGHYFTHSPHRMMVNNFDRFMNLWYRLLFFELYSYSILLTSNRSYSFDCLSLVSLVLLFEEFQMLRLHRRFFIIVNSLESHATNAILKANRMLLFRFHWKWKKREKNIYKNNKSEFISHRIKITICCLFMIWWNKFEST